MARGGQRGYGNAGRSAYAGGNKGGQSRAVYATGAGQRVTLARIRAAVAAAAIANPQTAPVFDPSKVTVTVGATEDTSLTKFSTANAAAAAKWLVPTGGELYRNSANNRAAIFNQNREGELGNFSATGFAFATTTPAPPPLASDATKTGLNATGPFRIFRRTDAPRMQFRLTNVTAGAAVRVLVNGQYVDKAGYDMSGSNNYLTLDFNGVRESRLITIEFQGLVILFSDRIDAGSSWVVDPTPANAISIIAYGDSHTQSGNNGSAYWGAATLLFGDRIGAFDIQLAGVASTAHTYKGGTNQNLATIGETILRSLPRKDFSIVILRGGFNDNGRSSAAITAALLAEMRQVRADKPNAIIVVMGTEGGATGPSAGIIATENAKRAAFDQANDRASMFIPISTDPAGAWQNGTGRVGAPNGTGNSDTLMGPDSTPAHANAAGEVDFADKWVPAFLRGLDRMVL